MRFTVFFLAVFFAVPVFAGVYKCTDSNGNSVYRSSPCTEGYSNAEIKLKTGSVIDLDEQKAQEALKQKQQQAMLEQAKLEQEQLLHKQAQLKQETMKESDINQNTIKSNPDKYSAFAIPPYVPEKLPPFVKPYEQRLPEIERLRRQAAVKALASNQCGRVEAVELNERSAQDTLVILVDCSSAKKFYFTEQELAG
ncbi:MAG: DUF4124 domain-containing protein [Methylococcaceae bacterium]